MHSRDDTAFADVGHHRVRRNSGERDESNCGPYCICGALDAEAREGGQMLVDRTVIPEAVFATANAAVA